jgi:3-oxoacyl-[acyl-carrier protein] reductase
MTHSSAARAAVEGATRELAADLEADGIGVVAVAAGHFRTDAIGKYPPEVQASVAMSVPLGRMGTPEEIAAAVVYLASQEAAYVTGQTLHINGGMAML